MYFYRSVFKDLASTTEFYLFIIAVTIMSVIGFKNYLLFHSFVEGYVILISFSLFLLSWNTRSFSTNRFLLNLSIGFFFIGIIDALHLFAYKGLGVFSFPDPQNPAPQFWITARYLQAFVFILASIFDRYNFTTKWLWIIFGSYTVLSVSGIFLGFYPDCHKVGIGQTSFKIYSEYLIALLFLIGSILVFKNKNIRNLKTRDLLSTSLLLMIVGEIFFTLYIDAYDIINLIGHIFKVLAFYLVYKSIIQENITSPINHLFKNLVSEKNVLKSQNINLQDQVSVYIHNLNFYKYALDQTSLIAITDKNGAIEYANDMFTKISKYS
ncbi:MAG: hypothetical protein EHM20_10060, partial [Alphaproteobacteria bacterium]